MAIGTEVVARRYEDIVAGVPISVDYPLYAATDVRVYYGIASLLAVYNTDYTITLGEDFDTFTLTPTASLITKIEALESADPAEVNYITVRRVLDYKTESTAAAVRYTPFTSREFERTAMRFQQLAENLLRAVSLPPSVVGTSPLTLFPGEAGQGLVFDAKGDLVPFNPSGFDFTGPWSASKNYIANDLVTYGGNVWVARSANVNVEPVDGDVWQIFLPGATVSDGSIGDEKISPMSRLYNRAFSIVDVKDPMFNAKGDNLTDDTPAFVAARDYAIATGRRLRVSEGTYRVSNAFNFGFLDVEFSGHANLKDLTGGLWQGGADTVYVGGNSSTPFALEEAYGPSGKALRVMSPTGVLIVDKVGHDPFAFPTPQSVFYKRHYRGKSPDDSYRVAQNHSVFVAYGSDMPPGQRASGSMPATSAGMKVYAAENGTVGITEMQAAAHYLRSAVPGDGVPVDVANGLNWWIRETSGSGKFQTAPGDYDAYLAGDTILVQKYTSGRVGTPERPYRGAFGAVITTIPSAGGFNDASASAKPTYPLDAMLAIGGFTGASGSVPDGHDAAATDGAFIGLQIGGLGTGIWTGTARSRFGRGIIVSDCIEDGIVVTGDNPQKSSGYNSIRTTPNSGRAAFGVTPTGNPRLHVGGPVDASATGDTVYLYETDHAVSHRASINFASAAILAFDLNANGSDLFGVRHVSSGRTPWFVDASGFMCLLALPTAANGDRIWRDGNGFLRIA